MQTNESNNITRRTFLKNTAAATAGTALAMEALGAPAIQASTGANDKVRVGFIGVGNRGTQLLQGFLAQSDCEVAALCDVYEPYLERDPARVDPRIIQSLGGGYVPKMGERFANRVERYADFRRLLEQKDVDAVVIATPDHWHALQTIMAFEAGRFPKGGKWSRPRNGTGALPKWGCIGARRSSTSRFTRSCNRARSGG